MSDNIEAELVSEENRINFLPDHFGSHFAKVQGLVFDLAKRFSDDYRGGLWVFYDLSNGAGYLSLDARRYLELHTPNGFSKRVNGNTFGLIISLYAINWLANETGEDLLIEQYYALRDFASQHIDRVVILRAID
jgi:hypothetical protein